MLQYKKNYKQRTLHYFADVCITEKKSKLIQIDISMKCAYASVLIKCRLSSSAT